MSTARFVSSGRVGYLWSYVPSRGLRYLWSYVPEIPPSPREQIDTDTCENITFPTTLAGGNKETSTTQT